MNGRVLILTHLTFRKKRDYVGKISRGWGGWCHPNPLHSEVLKHVLNLSGGVGTGYEGDKILKKHNVKASHILKLHIYICNVG